MAKDWELARKDAAKAIDVLRAAVAPVKEGNAAPKDMLERISSRISTRLNDWLCEMKPGYDDSIVGFNEAWDIVRAVFKDELSRVTEGVRVKDRPPHQIVIEEDRPQPVAASVVEALEECITILEMAAHQPIVDPDYGEEVARLGDRIGYGALMSSASASWRQRLEEDGYTGGQFVAGPCHSTVIKALEQARAALTAARDTEGKEPEAYRETVRQVAAAREKRLAELKGALERLANPEPMAFLQSLEADARIEFARSVLAPVSSTERS